MADMIRLVQTLEARGLAYERDGSVGNFFTLRALVAKGVDPMTFRFAIEQPLPEAVQLQLRGGEGRRGDARAPPHLPFPHGGAPGSGARRRERPFGGAGATPGARARRVLAGHRRRPEHARGAGRHPHARHRPERAGRLPAAHARGSRHDVVAFVEETNRIFATWPHEERQALDADVEAPVIEARRAAKAARN